MSTGLMKIVTKVEISAITSNNPEAFRAQIAAKTAFEYTCKAARHEGAGEMDLARGAKWVAVRNLRTALQYV